MSCDVINYLITALLWAATTSRGTPFLLTRRLILLPIFVRWLRKALQATLVLLLAPQVVELRREVGAIDYHLSRSISSSRYTPFLRKRSRSLLHNQVVKRTAMACGLVQLLCQGSIKIFKAVKVYCLALRSGTWNHEYKLYWMSMMWQLYVHVRKSIGFMNERSTPHLIACWVYSKQRNCLKVGVQHCGSGA